MTQNKARRTNEIDFLQLPWAQEVWSSNLPPDHTISLTLDMFHCVPLTTEPR